jgi:hypothetical protein
VCIRGFANSSGELGKVTEKRLSGSIVQTVTGGISDKFSGAEQGGN